MSEKHQGGKSTHQGRENSLADLVNPLMLEISMSEKKSACYLCGHVFSRDTMKRLMRSENQYVYFCQPCFKIPTKEINGSLIILESQAGNKAAEPDHRYKRLDYCQDFKILYQV
jgi:hypothetical protein